MVNHKVILDADPGVDDAIALIVALQSIDIEVLGISTVNGNIDSGSGALNTLRILHALGKSNIPVLQGATKPIIKRRIVRPEHFHGKGGLGGLQLELPKDKKILSKVQLSDFIELTLKNYRKREISIMGGAFRSHNKIFGSFTKYADFNFYCDPEAAKIVINQNVNVNRKFVGLDVTTNPLCAVGPELIRKIKNIKCITSRIRIIATLLDFAISTRKICHLHDVFAVAMLEKPSLFELKKGHIKVSLNGKMRGHSQFIEDNASSNNILVAANVNEKALNDYLISHLLK